MLSVCCLGSGKNLLQRGGLKGQPATVGKEPGDGIVYQWGKSNQGGGTGNFLYVPPAFNG